MPSPPSSTRYCGQVIAVPTGRSSNDEFLYNTSLRASWSICLTASFLCFSSTHPEVGEHVSALDVLRPELDLAVGLVLVTVLQVGEAHLEDTTLEAVGRNLRETRRCGKLTEMTSDLAQPYDDSLQANNEQFVVGKRPYLSTLSAGDKGLADIASAEYGWGFHEVPILLGEWIGAEKRVQREEVGWLTWPVEQELSIAFKKRTL